MPTKIVLTVCMGLIAGLGVAPAAGPALVARISFSDRKADDDGPLEKSVFQALATKDFTKAAKAFEAWTHSTCLPRSGDQAFQKLAALATTPADRRKLVELAYEAIDNYWDRYDKGSYGGIFTTILKVKSLSDDDRNRLEILKENLDGQSCQDDWVNAGKAFKKLATNPRDPQALAALSTNLCFGQGNWERGFAYAKDLPINLEPELHGLAQLEFGTGKSFEVADAWRSYHGKLGADHPRKKAAENRYRMLYARQVIEQKNSIPDRGGIGIPMYDRSKDFSKWLITDEPNSTPGLNQNITSERKHSDIYVWDTDVLGLIKGEKAGDPKAGIKPGEVKTIWYGRIIAPMSGRYVILLDGDAYAGTLTMTLDSKCRPTTSTVGVPKTQFTFNKAVPNPPEVVPNRATVVLEANSAAPFELKFEMLGIGTNKAALKWIRPGSTTPEVIPAEYMYKGPLQK